MRKNGVTVTQLDKSLYGLYQRNNLPPEANELLQKLEEVNILNLDLNQTDPSLSEKRSASSGKYWINRKNTN